MRLLLTLGSAALILSGCQSASRALGLTKSAPNEFNIQTKAPLVIPPEYNLRPPRAGESSAENNYSQQAAREALLGDIDPAEPTRGEVVLLAKAGANRADPNIRMVVDGQNSVERKTSGFSDRILFWRDGSYQPVDGTALDAETEAKRMQAMERATGGGKVEITRRPGGAKLPGL